MKKTLAVLVLIGFVLAVNAQTGTQTNLAAKHKMTKADFDRTFKEVSNWGRWGKDDQLGAINLITPAKRKEGLAQVKDGFSVSLAHDIEKQKAADNPSPLVHKMLKTGLDNNEAAADMYEMDFHGIVHTHLDALGHFFYQGKIFNGYSQKEITQNGAGKDSVLQMKNGLMTRGVLIDMARLKGVPYMEPRAAIYPEDLDAWEKMTGIKIQSGDALFIRTGKFARRKEKGAWGADVGIAGLHASTAKWLHSRDIAVLGSDGVSDVNPSMIDGVPGTAIHILAIAAMGMPLFDNCDLEALAAAAAQRNRYTFLLTAAPLAVPGGTGSPINPIATF